MVGEPSPLDAGDSVVALDGALETTAVDSTLSDDSPPIVDATDSDADALDAPVTEASVGCAGKKGAKMVELTVDGTYRYCIDTTEVTNAQFREFIEAPGEPYEAPPTCPSKSDDAGYRRPSPVSEASEKNKPVHRGVTWCFAYAYCKWAGKRLCGKIGGGPSTSASNLSSEWTFACANGRDENPFPYGDTYDKARCNTDPVPGEVFSATVDVASKTGCHGLKAPHDAIFDMSGNVGEYEDQIEAHATPLPSQTLRGGWAGSVNYADAGGASVQCDVTAIPFGIATDAFEDVGFRCCADP